MKLQGLFLTCGLLIAAMRGQTPKPLPDVRKLMDEVREHQRQLDKVRENYTFTSFNKNEELDAHGAVKKTETNELECFFVNSHQICRAVQKDGKPLDDKEEKKETERVTKLVEKAGKTPPEQPLEGQSVSISRVLSLMDVSSPRRVEFRGRATIVFDFIGRKDAKASGMAENASKKLKGTIWIDEADREISHLEVLFMDDYKIAGGLLATIDKGSTFKFDQAPIEGDLWLPTGVEADVKARVLMFKGERDHFEETDTKFQRFNVQTVQQKSVAVEGTAAKP